MPANYAPGSKGPAVKLPPVKAPPAPHDSGVVQVINPHHFVAPPTYHPPAAPRGTLFTGPVRPVATRTVQANPDNQRTPKPSRPAPVRTRANPDNQQTPTPRRVVLPNPDNQLRKTPRVGSAISSAPHDIALMSPEQKANLGTPDNVMAAYGRDAMNKINANEVTARPLSHGGLVAGAIKPGVDAGKLLGTVEHGGGGFLDNVFKGLVHLPAAMAQGISSGVGAAYQSGERMANDKGNFLQRLENIPTDLKPVGNFAKDSAASWEPVKLANDAIHHGLGHALSTLGHDAYTDPVGTAIQVIPAIGAPSRLAGAAMRTGRLGERAAQAASMARDTPTVAGGKIDLTHSDSYSPNVLYKQLVQKKVENSQRLTDARNVAKAGGSAMGDVIAARGKLLVAGKAGKADARAAYLEKKHALPALNAINKHSDWFHSAMTVRTQKNMEHLASTDHPLGRAIHAAMNGPLKGDVHAMANIGHSIRGNIVPHSVHISEATGLPMTPLEQAVDLRNSFADRLTNHDHGIGDLTPEQAQQLATSQHNLSAWIDSPNFDASYAHILDAHHLLAPAIHDIGRLSTHFGILDKGQEDRRGMMGYALQQMPGVRVATKGDLNSGALSHIEAEKAVGIADKAVTEAGIEHGRWHGLGGKGPVLTPEDRVATEALARYSRAAGAYKKLVGDAQKKINDAGGKGAVARTARTRIDFLTAQRAHLADAAGRAKAVAADVRRVGKQEAKDNLHAAKATRGEAANALQDLKDNGIKPTDSHDGLITPNEAHHPLDPTSSPMRPLDTTEIRQHIAANGNPATAYINEMTPRGEMAADHRPGGAIQESKRFTGTNNGAWDATMEGVLNSMHNSLYKVQTAHNAHDFINHAGVEHGVSEDPAALRARMNHWAEQGIPVTPMYEHGQGLSESQVAAIHGHQGISHEQEAQAYRQAQIDSHVVNPDDIHPGNRITLVPSQSLARQQAHLKVDATNNVFTKSNRYFRNAVLPISPKWMLGDYLESRIRNAVAGNGPLDAKFARRVLDPKVMGEGAVHDIHAMTGTTGFRNTGRFLDEAQATMHPGEQGGTLWTKLWRPWSEFRQGSYKLNSNFNHNAEMATLGGHFRQQIQDMKTNMATAGKSMDEYVQMVRDGLTGPDALKAQERATRQVNDVLGKYQGYSPAVRSAVKNWAPFLPWYLNSIKFIYHTMPAHHPMTTAALTAASHVYNQYGNPAAKGLIAAGKFSQNIFGTNFGDLVTGVNTGPNAYWDPNRYLPTGAFSGGPLSAVTQSALPWEIAPILAGFGLNTFGAKMVGPDGKPTTGSENVLGALQSVGDTFLNPAKRLFDDVVGGGRTPTDVGIGTYKKNYIGQNEFTGNSGPSWLNGLIRQYDPLRSTHLRPHGASTSSSSGSYNNNSAPQAISPTGGGLSQYNNSAPQAVGG